MGAQEGKPYVFGKKAIAVSLGILAIFVVFLMGVHQVTGRALAGATASGVTVDAEGTIVVVGSKRPAGIAAPNNLWVIGLDQAGETLWEHTYSQEIITGVDVIAEPGGGVAIAGSLEGEPNQAGVIRLDTHGELVSTWPAPTEERSFGFGVVPAPTGGFFLLGSSDLRPLITRFDKAGAGTVSLLEEGWARDLIPLPDGVLVATTYDMREGRQARYVPLLARLDANGQLQASIKPWNTGSVGALLPLEEDFLLVGTSNDMARVSAVGMDGTIRWDQLYGNATSGFAAAVETSDGWIFAGFTDQDDNESTGWVVRVDTAGAQQWELRLPSWGYDSVRDIVALGDDSFIVVGESDGDGPSAARVSRLNGAGQLLWDRVFVAEAAEG